MQWLSLEQWQQFVESHPSSMVFHHRRWIELLSGQYGFRVRIPGLVDGRRVVAAIPFLETRSLWGRRKLISLPFTDYLRLLTVDEAAIVDLSQAIQADAGSRFESIVVRCDAPIDGLAFECSSVRHEIDTARPLDEIESSYASALKRNIRRSRSHGLQFERHTSAAAVHEFYRLHVLTRKKLGVPVQSKTFFERLHEQIVKPGLGFVGIVKHHAEVVAAAVFLTYRQQLTYKYGASHPGQLAMRPNECLIDNAIRIASDEGYRLFDFGISSKQQDGLCRFKRKWGACETDVFHCYLAGQPAEPSHESRAAKMAAQVIQHSPTLVCRAVGKLFYKYSQ